MRKFIFWMSGLLLGIMSYGAPIDTIYADNPLIEYTGRIDFSNPQVPRFSYSGVSIRASFNGTSIAMIMSDNIGNNYYNILLDGQLLDTVKIGTLKKTYLISENLENKTHEIEIFKRTEEQFGKTQFYGFLVDAGTTLSVIEDQKSLLIEYIGNSITCGYGNEGVNGDVFGPTTENHYMTYAAINSRNFNARHLAVCKSGIGIYRNYNGSAAGSADCMSNYYTRTFLYDENPKYSFADQPDLVCINLGTNDFSTSGGDSALFVNNYLRLIDTIQTKYTMPEILCLLGPMLSGTTLNKVREYIRFIADSASKKGMGKVYFFEMSQQGSLGYAIDYHPTIAQHKKNGLELTEYIKSIEGWKIEPLIFGTSLPQATHIQLEFNTTVTDNLNDFEGFTVNVNGMGSTIAKVYRDSVNGKMLHIWLQQSIGIGSTIEISYTPGTIQTEDTVLLKAYNHLIVLNKLTETKITQGAISTDGLRAIFTFNKNVRANSTIEGLRMTNNGENVVIDSFAISAKILTLYLNSPILKLDTIYAEYSGNTIYGIDDVSLLGFSDFKLTNSSRVTTSISEYSKSSLCIYPNPNNTGIFFYKIDKNEFFGATTMELISSDGSILLKQVLIDQEGQINLQGKVSKGIYYVKISNDKSVLTHPIVFN